MKKLTMYEIGKQISEGKFNRNKIKYYVNVEGHELTTEFSLDGMLECLEFVHEYGIGEKRYPIEIIEEEEND